MGRNIGLAYDDSVSVLTLAQRIGSDSNSLRLLVPLWTYFAPVKIYLKMLYGRGHGLVPSLPHLMPIILPRSLLTC
jgi:hypothetical protein